MVLFRVLVGKVFYGLRKRSGLGIVQVDLGVVHGASGTGLSYEEKV